MIQKTDLTKGIVNELIRTKAGRDAILDAAFERYEARTMTAEKLASVIFSMKLAEELYGESAVPE